MYNNFEQSSARRLALATGADPPTRGASFEREAVRDDAPHAFLPFVWRRRNSWHPLWHPHLRFSVPRYAALRLCIGACLPRLRAIDRTHNAGVAGSSPAPAISNTTSERTRERCERVRGRRAFSLQRRRWPTLGDPELTPPNRAAAHPAAAFCPSRSPNVPSRYPTRIGRSSRFSRTRPVRFVNGRFMSSR